MKSKFLFFAVILSVVMAGTSLAANLVPNGSFEDGTGAPDGWGSWAPDGADILDYLVDQADAYDGVDYMALSSTTTNFQMYFHHDLDAAPDTEYFMSVMAKKPAGGADAVIEFKMEFYELAGGSETAGQVRDDAVSENITVSSETWEQYTITGTSHGTCAYITANCVALAGQDATVHFDDVQVDVDPISLLPKAVNGDPVGAGINPDDIAALSWDNTTAAEVNTHFGDTETASIEVEVYFDTNEAMVAEKNILSQILSRQARSSILSSDGEFPTIGSDVYYWLVRSYAKSTDGVTFNALGGDLWSFDTANTPPVVDAGPSINHWIEAGSTIASRKVTTSPVVTDDGLPGSGLVYNWVCPGATTCVTNPDGSATIGFQLAVPSGAYEATLSVNDGGGDDVTDTMVVNMTQYGASRLAAHYELEDVDGGVALDSASGAHHGVGVGLDGLSTPTAGASGQIGTAFDFDSDAQQYVEIQGSGYMTDPNIVTWAETAFEHALSVSCWIKTTATDGTAGTDWAGIVAKDAISWEMNRANDNAVAFKIQDSGVAQSNQDGLVNTVPFDGQWHHLVGTYDKNTVNLYIDGLLSATVAGTGAVPGGAANIKIGSTNNPEPDATVPPEDPSVWWQEWFAGTIDDVRLYDVGIPERSINDSPGVVELYRDGSGHVNCGGIYAAEDLNQNCYNDLGDFALIAFEWLDCSDIANPACD